MPPYIPTLKIIICIIYKTKIHSIEGFVLFFPIIVFFRKKGIKKLLTQLLQEDEDEWNRGDDLFYV